MTNLAFTYNSQRYQAPAVPFRAALGALVYVLTGRRVITEAARRYHYARVSSWRAHADRIQAELDEERRRGWGICAMDGRRVDF